jgi:hypothetical protein
MLEILSEKVPMFHPLFWGCLTTYIFFGEENFTLSKKKGYSKKKVFPKMCRWFSTIKKGDQIVVDFRILKRRCICNVNDGTILFL